MVHANQPTGSSIWQNPSQWTQRKSNPSDKRRESKSVSAASQFYLPHPTSTHFYPAQTASMRSFSARAILSIESPTPRSVP